MKKRIISAFMAVALTASLVACGGGNANTGSANTSSSEETSGSQYDGVTLTMWSMWNAGEPQANVIEAAAADFEAKTGAKVNIEWKGRDISTLIQASLESQDKIDIFEEDFNRISNAYADYTLDLTDMANAADYDSKSYSVFNNQVINWVGHLNSITEQPTVGGIFYNQEAFDKAGITSTPKTWTEFIDVCEKLKAAGIAPLAQDGAYCNFAFYNQLVRRMGEEAIAELRDAGNWAGNDAAIQTAQDIIDLRNAGYLVDGAPDEFPNSQNKLATGEAAMIVCANYVTAEVDAAMGDVKWGWFNYPEVEGGADPNSVFVGANSLAIPSYSANPQAAFDFILHITTGEWGQKYADESKQIPADPNNICNTYGDEIVDTLTKSDKVFSWCGSLNTHPAWQSMKSSYIELFEGKYATGLDFAKATDALY